MLKTIKSIVSTFAGLFTQKKDDGSCDSYYPCTCFDRWESYDEFVVGPRRQRLLQHLIAEALYECEVRGANLQYDIAYKCIPFLEEIMVEVLIELYMLDEACYIAHLEKCVKEIEEDHLLAEEEFSECIRRG